MRGPTRQHVLTAVAVAGGLALFMYAVRDTGWTEIAGGVRRLGWGIAPILAVAGLRFLARAEAWRLCAPPDVRLSRGRAFVAFLSGDALGNVTPLGLFASEPAKVYLIRHQLATPAAIATLAIDNLIYVASTLTVIAAAVVVALLTVTLPLAWQEAAVALLVVAAAGGIVAMRALSGGWTALLPAAVRDRLARVRTAAREFTAGQPLRLWRVFAIDMVFHALAALEVYLALEGLMDDATPTLVQSVLFSALNRVVLVAFKFVPFQVGVDELAAGGIAPLLGVPPAIGVALALVRKVRSLCWAAIGLALIAWSHGRAVPATDRRESASARRT